MRHLLDTYIKADESKKLSAFDDMTLVQLIVDQGVYAAERELPEEIRTNRDAVAETIENNVRRLLIDEMAVNPKYFEKMSELLRALIKERKAQAVHYTEYLQRIADLAKQIQKPETTSNYPEAICTAALRALYDNLGQNEGVALDVDRAVRETKKESRRGNRFKEREIRAAIKAALSGDEELTTRTFEIVKEQRDY